MFIKERNKLILPSKDIRTRIALIYPNIYELGMSSYTIHLLYSLFNSYSGIRCERFFFPNQKNKHIPLKSIDTGCTIDNFDVIAFSIHYELDYLNVLWLMENMHIPHLGKDRGESQFPLIIAGGSAVKSNPLLLLPFIDVLIFSDLEPIFEDMCKSLAKVSEENARSRVLDELHKLPNIIVSNYALKHLSSESPEKSFFPKFRTPLKVLDDFDCPIKQIIPEFQSPNHSLVFGETFLIEINRGCPNGCRFCLTGYINRPLRNRSLPQIKKLIDDSIIHTGAQKITLIGSAVTDHPNFREICHYIIEKDLEIMIPSVRIDKMTDETLLILRKGGVKSLTIAPETGTDHLRYNLNKGICNNEIIEKCGKIFNFGFQSIKFYFLIGLPFEKREDLDGIVNLIKEITQKVGKSLPKNGIQLSINPFIPKLFTPFSNYTEHYIDPKMEYLRTSEKFLRSELQNIPNVGVEFLNWKEARMQTILSQLDNTFAHLILDFYNMGAKPVDLNNIDKKNDYIITKYLRSTQDIFNLSIKTSSSIQSKQMNSIQRLIDIGFKKGYLSQELQLAKLGKIVGCEDNCYRCGIC
ncbi:MAG: radical SAM protein [Candidatus Lokiarchaeota archaeon]|nr:radical SAM protein [Candidatus Lokiarchaeota archaeon]